VDRRGTPSAAHREAASQAADTGQAQPGRTPDFGFISHNFLENFLKLCPEFHSDFSPWFAAATSRVVATLAEETRAAAAQRPVGTPGTSQRSEMPLSAADLQHLETEGWVLAKGIIPAAYIHALQVRLHLYTTASQPLLASDSASPASSPAAVGIGSAPAASWTASLLAPPDCS
jgi:hypothetical protein